VIDKKTTEVANVPKITPVKEGQEYPLGKHGQYKLFHEHVWPRGYTPERLKQVNDLQFGMRASGYYPIHEDQLDFTRKINNNIARTTINGNIARSTIPIEDLQKIKEFSEKYGNPTSFWVGYDRPYPEASEYSVGSKGISVAIAHDDQPVDLQATVTHELGHALDDATDSNTLFHHVMEMKEDPLAHAYGKMGNLAHPVLEGTAEGYSIAHSRITRDQKRRGGENPVNGYSASGWLFPGQQEKFRQARRNAFAKATGRQLEPTPVEEPKKEYKDNPVLPGMERFM